MRRRRGWTIVYLGLALLATVAAGIAHAVLRLTITRQVFAAFAAALLGAGLLVIKGLADRPEPQQVRPSDLPATRVRGLRSKRKRADISTPKFFRAPPCYVDFQRNYVVSHPLLESINRRVQQQLRGVLIIEGLPASGKSTIARHLEYVLLKSWRQRFRRHLYTIDGKSLEPTKVAEAVEELRTLPNRSIVVFDDAHRHLIAAAEVCRYAQTRDLCVILVTRPLSNYPRDLSEPLLSLHADHLSVDANDVADQIIENYLRVELQIPNAGEVAERFVSFRGDLWVLSTALQSAAVVNGHLEVSRRRIQQWIIDNLVAPVDIGDLHIRRDLIVLPLAALYRFEVATSRRFLLDTLGVPDDHLRALENSGDIVSDSGGLRVRMYHSSLAELVLDSLASDIGARALPSILLDAKLLKSRPWPDQITAWQVMDAPVLAATQLAELADNSKAGRDLARDIVLRMDPHEVATGLGPDRAPVAVAGSFLRVWVQARRGWHRSIASGIESYVGCDGESDPQAWAWLIAAAAEFDAEMAPALAGRLAEILPDTSLHRAASIATTLSYVSKDAAERSLSGIDPVAVPHALAALGPADRVATLAKLVWVRGELARYLPGLLPVMHDIDPDGFGVLLGRFAWGNGTLAADLLARADPAELADLIRGCTSIEATFESLGAIANVIAQAAVAVLDEMEADMSADPLMRLLSQELRRRCVTTPTQSAFGRRIYVQ